MENEHNELTNEAVEALMSSIFGEMLTLAKKYDITVKRMRDLLLVQQLSQLQQQGLNQLEMMAASGYTRRWIKKILTDPPASQRNSLAKFVSDWARDPEFPDELPLSGQYPSFGDICERYGKDYTEPALRKILREKGITYEVNNTVVLNRHREVTHDTDIDAIHAAKASISALFRTLQHNLHREAPAFTERRIWSDSIPLEKVPELRERMRDLNAEHILAVLALLKEYQEAGREDGERMPHVVGLGMYWYELDH
jgi:hypothetical protein